MRVPTRILASAVLITLAFAACGDDDEDVDESADDAASDTVQLVASDFEFTPAELPFAAGEETQITFTNTGQAKHNFTVDGTDVDEDVDANGEVTFDFTAPGQTASFQCKYHPDTMLGTITITGEAGGGGTTNGASASPAASDGSSPSSTDDDDDDDDDEDDDDDGGSAGGGYGY
jgi:plastocyanin